MFLELIPHMLPIFSMVDDQLGRDKAATLSECHLALKPAQRDILKPLCSVETKMVS